MAHVQLGNTAPHEKQIDRKGDPILDDKGGFVFDALPAPAVTYVNLPDSDTLVEQLRAVADLWSHHSSEAPSWIETDSEALSVVLHGLWPTATIGAPGDLEATHYTHAGAPGVATEESA